MGPFFFQGGENDSFWLPEAKLISHQALLLLLLPPLCSGRLCVTGAERDFTLRTAEPTSRRSVDASWSAARDFPFLVQDAATLFVKRTVHSLRFTSAAVSLCLSPPVGLGVLFLQAEPRYDTMPNQ